MSVFSDTVLDYVEGGFLTVEEPFIIDRYPDYIRLTHRRTGRVAIIHVIHLIETDREYELRVVEDELAKGVPEHE